MKKTTLLVTVAGGTIFLWGCSGGPAIEVQSRWSDSGVVMDGSADDWAQFPLEYCEEEKISLGVRNDADDIYFLFMSRDESLVRKIRMAGVTLWFDATGGKKKDFGIRYTGSVALMESLDEELGFWENMPPEQMARLERRRSEMQGMITVIEKGKEVSMPENNPKGPAAASANQDGIFGYEFRIPIGGSDSVSYGIGALSGNQIGMGLELAGVNAEDREETMQQRSQTGGSRGSGTRGTGTKGGDRRGMRGRGPEGDGERSEEQMLKKQEIWISIHLARNPHLETEEN